MQALGLIETRGLIAAVESADAMLKAAEVTLIDKTYVGGGLVSIAVTGDVGAVKAAVEAGAAAVRQINSTLLVSEHIIPRPHEELDGLVVSVKPVTNAIVEAALPAKTEPAEQAETENEAEEEAKKETKEKTELEKEVAAPDIAIEEKKTMALELNLEEVNKDIADNIVLEYGLEEALEVLDKLKVTKLRNLAREYKTLRIAGRLISKADKKMLLEEFKEYYKKN